MTTKKNRSRGTELTFVCDVKPNAKKVFLAGDFNNWNPESDRMTKRNGSFRKKIKLAGGEHQYKFVVDGEWIPDPSAAQVDNGIGSVNSLVHI